MRVIALLLSLVITASFATAQSPKNTGKAESSGSCSLANSGSIKSVDIQCGIGEEQGRKIITLLNQVLAGDDLASINSKLDALLKFASEQQPRRLSKYQIDGLASFLSKSPDPDFVGISYNSNDRDTMLYAADFIKVFRDKRWHDVAVIMMGQSDPQFGVSVDISPEDKANPPQAALAMFQELKSLGIEAHGQLQAFLPKGKYGITIGLRPSQ